MYKTYFGYKQRSRPKRVKKLPIYAVYLLRDPYTKEVRYIGQTTNFIKRMGSWQSVVKNEGRGQCSLKLKEWFRELNGKVPHVEVACYCSSRGELYDKELEWIAKGVALGWNLCNTMA